MLALLLGLPAIPVQAQEPHGSLRQRISELLLSWELTGTTPEADLKGFSDSAGDPLSELREALLLSRLERYTEEGRRRSYLEDQFLPFLQRQDPSVRESADALYLEALALRDLGRLEEALAIAEGLPATDGEDGDGYALWAALLLDLSETDKAAKAIDAGLRFYPGNLLLMFQQLRRLELAGESEAAYEGARDLAAALGPAGFGEPARLAVSRRRAGLALRTDRFDDAMNSAGAVLAKYPQDSAMLLVAAEAAAGRRQFNLAAEYQQQFCALSPSVDAWLALAAYRAESGQPAAADAFNAALAIEPRSPEALLARAGWLADSGSTDEAVADLRSLLEAHPDNREASRMLARLLASGPVGDTAEGEEQLRQVLLTDPSPAAYLDLLDILAADPQRRQEYENTYNDMLVRFRSDPTVTLAHARRLLEQEKYTRALEEFRRGEGLDPQEIGFPLGIGDSLRAMGGFDEARSAYGRALSISYDPLAVAGLARSLERGGDSAAAEELFNDYLNEHPRDPELVMQYGLFLFERTDYTAALEQYDLGQQLEPDNEMFINRAALCLFKLNQIPEAIERLKRAINTHPRPLFYRNLAIAYEEDAETELAEQYYRDGMELFPGDRKLLESYSEFLEQQGRTDEALQVLMSSAELEPDVEILMDLATLAQSTGRNALARDSYEKAVAIDPFDLVINERYCTFLTMQGDNETLLRRMEDALTLMTEADFDELLGTMTGFWIEQGRSADGELVLSQLIEIDPTVVRMYNSLALMQHLDGDNETALTTVRRGQRYAGESFLGLYLETLISWRGIGVNEALPLGAELIEHPQADSKSWLLYLDMLASADERATEAEVAARGLRRYFGDEQIYAHLVEATRRLGDVRALISVLEDPQYVRIRHPQRPLLLGRSYLADGNFVKAVASLQPLLEEDGFNERALRLSGEANFMLGEQDTAREQLTTALAINPEYAEASVWLGWVLLEDGDLAGAEQSFSTAEKSPGLEQLQLGWTRLGQASVAIRRGERMQASSLLKQAESLGGGDPRFDSYLPRVREEIQPGS